MSRLTIFARTTALAALLTGTAQTRQIVTIGHTQSATSHYGARAEAFFDTLEELSGGEWTGEQAAAGALGGERDMIEALQLGSLDLPFPFRDYAHARKVLDGEVGQELLDKIGENDLAALAWTENGFRHVTNSRHAVETPEGLDGLKLRTMENRVHRETFEAMGAEPTLMAFPELFTALQQGVVDGQENPVTVISAANFWEVQDYASLTGDVSSPAVILASPILQEGLSDEEKGWFREAVSASASVTRNEVSRLEQEVSS